MTLFNIKQFPIYRGEGGGGAIVFIIDYFLQIDAEELGSPLPLSLVLTGGSSFQLLPQKGEEKLM